MAKRIQRNAAPPPEEDNGCYYRNGRRTFRGTEKDVAKYAFRDQYLQWGMMIALIAMAVFCLLRGIAPAAMTGLLLIKKWF